MDDSDGTVANGGVGGLIPNIPEESFWHAIPKSGKADEVLRRKKELWDRVVAERDATRRLQRLGVFFHYQQDTWAHRKHPSNHSTNFTTYSTPLGHAVDGYQPDRPPFDPVCALSCLEDSMAYARLFVTQCLTNRSPNPLFNNYSPAQGVIDVNWTDKRKGKFFNTLVVDTSTPARRFLTDLIRSQINAYTTSYDVNPNYSGRYTADEARYPAVKEALEGACSRAGVNIPAVRPRVTNLTTSQFQEQNLGTATYSVKIYTGDKIGAGTDANIFLSITGTNGQIGEQRLNALISGNAFERNQTDYVTLVNLASVGELVRITVRSDNRYPSSGWYLGWIEISSPGIRTRRFTFNRWIESPNLSATVASIPSPPSFLCASDSLTDDVWPGYKPVAPLTFLPGETATAPACAGMGPIPPSMTPTLPGR
jgi:hypothetical protein